MNLMSNIVGCIIKQMSYEIKELGRDYWPAGLMEIPEPPEKLWYAGALPDYSRKLLCVVGSRKFSSYGKEAVEYLVGGLAGYPVTIVSGLALGIDAIAHRAAIKNNLPTIAMPGSGLSPKAIHPQTNVELANEIVHRGGTLISEMRPDEKASLMMHNTASKKVFWSFPRRNRLMVGFCDAVLVIEAGLKSGTLITARLATDYNRELLTVPGNIFSSTSEGSNMLLRLGAAPARNPEDILEALNLNTPPYTLPLLRGGKTKQDYSDCNETERKILELLSEPCERDILIRNSGLTTHEAQTVLTLLEIKGYVQEVLGELRLVA
jgi:DNA processing protein